MEIIMSKEVLLIIDMLNDFVLEGAPLEVPETRKVIPAIKKEIENARAKGSSVIYVCDAHEKDDKEFSKFGWPAHAVKGTKGAEIVDELKPEDGDITIEKTTYSGFYDTKLDGALKNFGVNSLRLTGCVTHICVMFTASDAVLRDYKVAVVENGVAGLSKDDHDAALRIMKNVMGVKMV
jgi:nicotinamidase-related amidase